MKKTVVITGGNDGLGKALAKQLVEQYNVVIIARNEEKTKKVSEELKCDYVICDISQYKAVEEAVGQIQSKYGFMMF